MREMQPQAHMRAAAKRHPGVFVPVAQLVGRESHRIETLRIVPVFGRMVDVVDVDPHHCVRRNPVAAIVEALRSEEHTSELQSLMRISYVVFCLKKNNNT